MIVHNVTNHMTNMVVHNDTNHMTNVINNEIMQSYPLD